MKIPTILAASALMLASAYSQNTDQVESAPQGQPPQTVETNLNPGAVSPEGQAVQIVPVPVVPGAEQPAAPEQPQFDTGANETNAPSGDVVIRPSGPAPGRLVAPSERAQFTPPAAGKTNANDLHLNFRGAPIEMVLNYLSDAAGFIIELDTPVHGDVDIWSDQPVSKEEALQLLNSVLNQNGYAVIRNGRVLRVMNRDDAIHSDIPVKVLSEDPASIPKDDEIVTEIIPIRFVEAKQLTTDLSPLFSAHATIIANEAGNSIAITDTQANIRHIAEVIHAIDSSAEDVTEVRVFHLQYHDPVEVANLLSSLFSEQGNNNNGGSQAPIRFGGSSFGSRYGGFGGGFLSRMMAAQQASGGSQGSGSTSDRIKQHSRVVAVADQRTSSVVVTASKGLIDEIGDMITQIDHESPKVAHVSVVHLRNADPEQVQQTLQDLFQSGGASRNGRSGTQQSPLMTRLQQSTGTTGSSSSTSGSGFGGGFGGGGSRFGGGGGFGGGF